jgi:hypothetical protein
VRLSPKERRALELLSQGSSRADCTGDGGQSVLRPRAPREREAEAARRPVVDKVEDRPPNERGGPRPTSALALAALPHAWRTSQEDPHGDPALLPLGLGLRGLTVARAGPSSPPATGRRPALPGDHATVAQARLMHRVGVLEGPLQLLLLAQLRPFQDPTSPRPCRAAT